MAKPNEGEDQREPRFSQEQYDRLERCADAEDVAERNKWRREHPHEDVMLEGERRLSHWSLKGVNLGQLKPRSGSGNVEDIARAQVYLKGIVLDGANLEGANLSNADLTGASLIETHLERANLRGTCLQSVCAWNAHFEKAGMKEAILNRANLQDAHLEGAMLNCAELRGTILHMASVDGATILWRCTVNQQSKVCMGTDLSGVALDAMKIDPGTKQLLEYNIRRKNWEDWYKEHPRWKWAVETFWRVSDYGLSTGRIVGVFFGLAAVFALVYCLLGLVASPGLVDNLFFDRAGQAIAWWLVPLRSLYFSIVTMTTLGFGDMYANPYSVWGHILLGFQVILGYVLLGALVTRFAVLFAAGGPAGKFADDKGIIERMREFVTKRFGRKEVK